MAEATRNGRKVLSKSTVEAVSKKRAELSADGLNSRLEPDSESN